MNLMQCIPRPMHTGRSGTSGTEPNRLNEGQRLAETLLTARTAVLFFLVLFEGKWTRRRPYADAVDRSTQDALPDLLSYKKEK